MVKNAINLNVYLITLIDKKAELVQLSLIWYVIDVSESDKNSENNPRRTIGEKTVDFHILTILQITREYNWLEKT